MKVITVFGTRPEIIRLSQVIQRLDGLCEHILVHTGQNYDPNLSDIFFAELGVRRPDIHLGIKQPGFAAQVGSILTGTGRVFAEHQPDRVLILGDTNSGLAALVAARMRIPVYHMEAGNRCYDNRVPEEINRRVIDHSSDVLMPYTHRSKENLLREGIERQRIFVTGNPIYEVLEAYAPRVTASDIHTKLAVQPGAYFLVTLHRAENVDLPDRLALLLSGLDRLAAHYQQPIIVSLHPRTAARLQEAELGTASPLVKLLPPFGFFDFAALEKAARCVISDSGTVQEECAIFRVPNVTIRDVTERAETIEAGSNMLSGAHPDDLLRAVNAVLTLPGDWTPPEEYVQRNVSSVVARIVLEYAHGFDRR